MPEGLIFCECRVGLPPDEDMINKIKARFQALTAPYYHARINRSRWTRHGDQPRQEDHWKAVDETRGVRKHIYFSTLSRWWDDEKYRNSQLAIGWTETYCRYLDHLSGSKSPTMHPIIRGTVTRTLSRWKVAIRIFRRDQCVNVKTTKQQQNCYWAFVKKKEKPILVFRRNREPGIEMNWRQNFNSDWNG